MGKHSFSGKNFALVLLLTAVVGMGMYFVAWQFNDGKISKKVVGAIFLGMALPSLLIGGVMRLFKPGLQRYFALTAGICLGIGLFLILG